MKTERHLILNALYCVFGLSVLSLAATASADEVARLANERVLVPGDVSVLTGSSIHDSQKCLARLSPDGGKLLYYRADEIEIDDQQERVLRIVLRNVTDGSEWVLPIPAFRERFVKYLPMTSFTMNPFDKQGNKFVLGVGIDANENGVFDPQDEKMQAIVCDYATSTTAELAVTADIVAAAYGSMGERLVVFSGTREDEQTWSIKMMTSPTNTLEWRELVLSGTPKALSPDRELLVLAVNSPDFESGSDSDRPSPTDLVLYDTVNEGETVTLPTWKYRNIMSLFAIVWAPQWTASGHQLFYLDLLGNPEDAEKGTAQPRHGTKVWDQNAQKIVHEMPDMLPLGPGLKNSSMVLIHVDEVREDNSQVEGIAVYDALNGQTWEIPLQDVTILGIHGGSLIYARNESDGKTAIYIAEIICPLTQEEAVARITALGGLVSRENDNGDGPPIRVDFSHAIAARKVVGNEGLAAVANLPELRYLFVPWCKIDDIGLGYLGELHKLDSLSLRETEITDAGLLKLAHLQELIMLDLAGTQITDAGLGNITMLSSLAILVVTDTQVTEAGLRELQTRLPALTVYHESVSDLPGQPGHSLGEAE